MKEITTNLITTVLAFALGVDAALFWHWIQNPVKDQQTLATTSQSSSPPIDPTVGLVSTAEPVREAVFGAGRLKIVRDDVHLKNERLRYDINVSYPQIVGSDELYIKKLNRHIKQLAVSHYQWPLTPSKSDLRHYKQTHPEAFNTIDLDYDVRLATDSLLSIYFEGFSYGIGAAHSVQYSFVINYDLILRKELRLADLFKGRSKSLEFLSHYCMEELTKGPDGPRQLLSEETLAPVADNFKSWNITSDGLTFNFDACRVFGCSDGKQAVQIPFTALKPWLKTKIE